MQLPFAVVPLVKFTGSKVKMGPFAGARWLQSPAWLVTALIVLLNGMLVYQQTQQWMAAGEQVSLDRGGGNCPDGFGARHPSGVDGVPAGTCR